MGFLSDLFGGSSKTKVSVPGYVTDAHKDAIGRAQQSADIGYMPYQGPSVAALNDAHKASYQGFDALAGAFGMPAGAMSAFNAMPEAQDFGGVKGHSAAPVYDWAKAEWEAKYPAQAAAYNGMFMDPVGNQQGGAPAGGGVMANPGAGYMGTEEYLAQKYPGMSLSDFGKPNMPTLPPELYAPFIQQYLGGEGNGSAGAGGSMGAVGGSAGSQIGYGDIVGDPGMGLGFSGPDALMGAISGLLSAGVPGAIVGAIVSGISTGNTSGVPGAIDGGPGGFGNGGYGGGFGGIADGLGFGEAADAAGGWGDDGAGGGFGNGGFGGGFGGISGGLGWGGDSGATGEGGPGSSPF